MLCSLLGRILGQSIRLSLSSKPNHFLLLSLPGFLNSFVHHLLPKQFCSLLK